MNNLPAGVTLRTDVRPGDVATIVQMHGTIYAREYGFDETFSAYVDRPLTQFAIAPSPRDRLWIAERDRQIVGSIAIVGGESSEAQLRWFLVDPSLRGLGLGRRLMHEAIAFAAECRYESVFLWTVSALTAAAHLYRAAGFAKVEEKPGHWGVDVIEEKYVLRLPPGEPRA
jgi:ribosomal protein S18 acetylase RimI-like enzyme